MLHWNYLIFRDFIILVLIFIQLTFQISTADFLPQTVCSECLSQLVSACKLKETSLESDKILRSQFNAENYDLKPSKEVEDQNRVSSGECLKNCDNKKEQTFEDVKLLQNEQVEKPRSKVKQKPRESSTFKCYICDKLLTTKKEKNQHLEHFHQHEELKCKICRHKSQTPRGLDNHLMLHEKPDLLFHMCHICGKKNYQKGCELRRHIKLAHGDKSKRQISFYCDHCDFKTFSKMNIKRHLSTIHLKIKAFGCQFCPDKKYTSKITLEQHMISKHGQETDFVCQCCQRKFPTMSFLRSHLKSTCSGSPGTVRERGDPNSYREPVLDEKDHYRCKLCGLIFEGKGKIAQHYAQRHKHNNSCDLCSASFNSYSNLKKHIQILHNKIHKYSCSYCSRSFGQKNQLQSHM